MVEVRTHNDGGSFVKGTKFMVIQLKEVLKTTVFAVLGVIILVGLIWFFLGMGEDSATYEDGVYHAQVKAGKESATVSVTIAEGMIAEVSLNDLSETALVFYPLLADAAEEVGKEVVKTQSLQIQVEEQNAYSAQAILDGVQTALKQAQPE